MAYSWRACLKNRVRERVHDRLAQLMGFALRADSRLDFNIYRRIEIPLENRLYRPQWAAAEERNP